jgi:phosphotriesterase-related protein
MGVKPEAFIWVHAQNEKDTDYLLEAARRGAWISMDHFNQKAMDRYVEVIDLFRKQGLLHRLLISHDAGWYEPETGLRENFQPYTPVFDYLVPFFENRSGIIDTVLRVNPAQAFLIRKRLHE